MNHQTNRARTVLSAVLSAVAIIVLGVTSASTAHAQYPPQPPPPPAQPETPPVDVGSDAPEAGAEVSTRGPDVPAQPAAPTQGTLPSTGGSGVTTALAAAGIALLLGLAVTAWSKASTRRHSNSTSG